MFAVATGAASLALQRRAVGRLHSSQPARAGGAHLPGAAAAGAAAARQHRALRLHHASARARAGRRGGGDRGGAAAVRRRLRRRGAHSPARTRRSWCRARASARRIRCGGCRPTFAHAGGGAAAWSWRCPRSCSFAATCRGGSRTRCRRRWNLFGARVGWAWILGAALFGLGHYLVTLRAADADALFPGAGVRLDVRAHALDPGRARSFTPLATCSWRS